MNSLGFVETLWHDLRYGARILRRNPTFAIVPGLAAWGAVKFDLADGGESRPAQGLFVNGAFFETLGVHAQLGRVLTPADDVRGCAVPSIVLSQAFWRREFAGSPTALGRTMKLDGHAYQIVGITPSSFFGIDVGRSFDIAAPICAEPLSRGTRSGIDKADVWFLAALGRLEPGVTAVKADAQLRAVSRGIFEAIVPPNYTAGDAKNYLAFTLTTTPASTGVSSLRGAYATPLWILLGVTGLVLLVACANLANLMLARATAREREIAVRRASVHRAGDRQQLERPRRHRRCRPADARQIQQRRTRLLPDHGDTLGGGARVQPHRHGELAEGRGRQPAVREDLLPNSTGRRPELSNRDRPRRGAGALARTSSSLEARSAQLTVENTNVDDDEPIVTDLTLGVGHMS